MTHLQLHMIISELAYLRSVKPSSDTWLNAVRKDKIIRLEEILARQPNIEQMVLNLITAAAIAQLDRFTNALYEYH